MIKKINIIDISDWEKTIEDLGGICDYKTGAFFPDYTDLECNFETMFGIKNNKAIKLFVEDNKLRINDWNNTLLPEHIQNSYKKYLISKALKEKLK